MWKFVGVCIIVGVLLFLVSKVIPGVTGPAVGGLAGDGASEALAGLGGFLRGALTGLGRAFTG